MKSQAIAGYLATLGRFRRDVWLYYAFWIGFAVYFFGIYAVIFNLYLVRLGYGPEYVGTVQGLVFLGMSIFCVPAGWLGKRFGPRRMLIASSLLFVPNTLAIASAEFVPIAWRDLWIAGNYGLSGVLGSNIVVNSIPFLMGLTNPQERGHAFAVLNAVRRLSGFVGSLIAGALPGMFATILRVPLTDPAPYRYPLFIPPVLHVVGSVLLLSTREPEVSHEQKETVAVGRPPFGLICSLSFVFLLWMAGTWSARTFFNVYMDTSLLASTPLIGALLAAGQLLSGLTALATPLVEKALGRFRLLVILFMGFAAGQAILGFLPFQAAAAIGFVAIYALFGIADPVYTVYIQEIVAAEWRPIMAGYSSMAWGLGTSALIFGGGYIAAARGYRSLFNLGMIMAALCAAIFYLFFRVPRGEYRKVQ
jgi:MFS family permease